MSRSLAQKEHQIFTSFQQKLVLKEVNAKTFSVIKDNRHFTCATPVIYKIENTDAYIVFGNLQGGYDINKLKEELMKYQQQNINVEKQNSTCKDETCKDEACNENVCNESTCNGVEIDNTKIVKEDVDTLVEQTGCTRKEAMQALAQCNYDCVEAIIKLEEKNKK